MNNRRILVVDDNRALQEDFRKILIPIDEKKAAVRKLTHSLFDESPMPKKTDEVRYEIDFADQGEAGFQKALAAHAAGTPYALIFMDVRMPPGWDGITTIAKIWETLPLTEVVICTAYSDYSIDEVIKKLGISERLLLLKKPFDSAEVQQMALTLTTKWNLEQLNLRHTENLEQLVAEKIKALEIERANSINCSKLAALGEMAGGVAHEINNPLAIILSNISLQKELLLEETIVNKMIVAIADKIEATTERIAKIVRGLRAISRSGDDDAFIATSVAQIIRDAVSVCGEKFKYNNVKFTFDETQISDALTIDCRETQIIQVLLNLLGNAFDAIQNLSEKWITVVVKDTGVGISLSVTDSGPGISSQVLEKIFQPFFTTKEVGQGTGLGLSISKRIVEEHCGKLMIDTENRNTCFVIYLPKKNNSITVLEAV